MKIFYNYKWPGNVRELENLMEGIMSIYDVDLIDRDKLPPKFREENTVSEKDSLPEILEETEKRIITEALIKINGILPIQLRTLKYHDRLFNTR